MRFVLLRKTRLAAVLAVITTVVAATSARAQDTTTVPGVRLGLSYQAGTKPGVIVLPIQDDYDDSLRTIVSRDLDFSDRFTVIALDHATLQVEPDDHRGCDEVSW